METKIPPPIVTLIFGLAIYFSREMLPVAEIQHSSYLGVFLLLIGFFVLISAVRLFRKDNTTVNPLSPDQATKLVTDGIFKYTRNPMYLGMAFILGSISVFFNLLGGILLVALFCAYITKFQIIPEERAMKDLFSHDFEKYTKSTRRWI